MMQNNISTNRFPHRNKNVSNRAAPPSPLPHPIDRAVVTYCVFSNSSVWEDVQESDLSNYINQFIADIITARGYVFGFGFGVATLVAFVYIGILQIPFLVGFVVWSCVILVLVGLLALGFGAWSTAEDWNEDGTKSDVSLSACHESQDAVERGDVALSQGGTCRLEPLCHGLNLGCSRC